MKEKHYRPKNYEDLKFTDDFLFGKILYSSPEICRKMLELLLDVEIEKVEAVETQKSLKSSYAKRGVRLDVYVKDDKGSVYDIEMQTVNSYDIDRRSEQYLSSMLQDSSREGEDFKEFSNCWVIFIFDFDYYRDGKYVDYPVLEGRRVFLQDPAMMLKDRGRTLYINTHGNLKELPVEKRYFFEYIKTGDPGKSRLAREIDEKVEQARNNEHWGNEYMTLEERVRILMETDLAEAREEARAEGRAEGKAEGRSEGISLGEKRGKAEAKTETAKAMKTDGLSFDKISKFTGLSLKEIEAL